MQLSSRRTSRKILRRTLFALVLPLLTLLLLRLAWGLEAAHRLAAVRTALLAKGVRLNPVFPAIPDNQNAAVPLLEAFQKMTGFTHAERYLVNGGNSPSPFVDTSWSEPEHSQLRLMLAKYSAILDLTELAARRPLARWPRTDPDSPTAYNDEVYARELADMLYDGAILAHEDHNDAAALHDLDLILAVSAAIDQDPREIAHLVAAAIRALAGQGLERFEPQLHLRQSDGSLPAAGALLLSLMNIDAFQKAKAAAWEAEIETVQDQPPKDLPRFFAWWLNPLFLDETARARQAYGNDVPSTHANNWPAAAALPPKPPSTSDSTLNEITCLASEGCVGNSRMYSVLHFDTLTDSGAAALLLAARIYQAEHSALPTSSAQLTPAILPHLPADPFAADNRPLRFRLDPTGPTVWSVGKNGTDEEGTVMPPVFDSFSTLHRYGGNSDPARNPPDIVYGAAWRIAKAAAASRPSSAPSALTPSMPGIGRPPFAK